MTTDSDHYETQREGTVRGDRKRPVAERFWEKVDKQDGGCWIWNGSTHHFGHGSFRDEHRRTTRAHRWAWKATHGPIPDGMCVCHHCDNPPCVNPEHLFLGTIADNNMDAAEKGRLVIPRAGKLTPDAVVAIRNSTETTHIVAKRYGVSLRMVQLVRTRRVWKHVA